MYAIYEPNVNKKGETFTTQIPKLFDHYVALKTALRAKPRAIYYIL